MLQGSEKYFISALPSFIFCCSNPNISATASKDDGKPKESACTEVHLQDFADRFLFNLAPILIFVPVLIVLGLIPYSSEFTFMNFQTNLLIYITLATLPVLSILLAGWASNNKYSLMGAMRNVAQVLAYELPIAFVVLSIIALSGSMNLTQIILAQSSQTGLFGWFVLPCLIGFVIMFICVLAELNRCPFDLPEAESELICGYNTEYSGMRFALFYLSEYGMLFANSLLLAVLFLGGYLSPFGKYLSPMFIESQLSNVFIYFEQAFWLFAKTFLLLFVVIWVRATFPRMASFDLLKFSWSVLLPISIINLFVMVVLKYLVSGGVYA